MTRILASQATVPSSIAHLPKPGDVLGDRYEVIREIGAGGMGVVYEVRHTVMTDTLFAIKWLVARELNDSEAIRRFKREARICGRIRHPNVVQVYDVSITPDASFMVMELLQGESLAAKLRRTGALEMTEACAIVRHALAGVAAAHEAGVIHRDLKPENIFLSLGSGSERMPKVLDFGICCVMPMPIGAQEQTAKTAIGVILGTPAYMAPEQLRADSCDARTDVYALGVTLYEALSGRRPFSATTHAEHVHKILAGDANPLQRLVPALPSRLCEIVMKAMHKTPELRFSDAEHFVNALAPYVCRQASATRSSRRTRILWLVAPVVLALGVVASMWALHARSSSAPANVAVQGQSAVPPGHVQQASVAPAQPIVAHEHSMQEPTLTPLGAATLPQSAAAAGPQKELEVPAAARRSAPHQPSASIEQRDRDRNPTEKPRTPAKGTLSRSHEPAAITARSPVPPGPAGALVTREASAPLQPKAAASDVRPIHPPPKPKLSLEAL